MHAYMRVCVRACVCVCVCVCARACEGAAFVLRCASVKNHFYLLHEIFFDFLRCSVALQLCFNFAL